MPFGIGMGIGVDMSIDIVSTACLVRAVGGRFDFDESRIPGMPVIPGVPGIGAGFLGGDAGGGFCCADKVAVAKHTRTAPTDPIVDRIRAEFRETADARERTAATHSATFRAALLAQRATVSRSLPP